jgi:hypothetical protein
MNDFVEDCIVKYKWGEQTFFYFLILVYLKGYCQKHTFCKQEYDTEIDGLHWVS